MYSVSEDYRFFLKKLKYSEDVVYDETLKIDDIERIELVTSSDDDTAPDDIDETQTTTISSEGMKFLDILSGEKEILEEETIPELNEREVAFVDAFEKRFVLSESESLSSLFDITTEYPDDYYEFSNKHISVYVFPTKSYEEVKKIFEVLEYELPYQMNEVNNFGDKSLYINLDDAYADGVIRMILEYKNRAFWLKIKKDNYNTVKEILNELSS